MPLIGTRGVASASGFGFGASSSPYWLGNFSYRTYENVTSTIVDGDGNIYVAGSYNYDFTYGYYRCYIQKYTKSGILLWGKYYGYGSTGQMFSPIITLDNQASPSYIYMAAGNPSTNYTALFKISVSDGSVSWNKQLSGSNSWSWAGVAVSGSYIYVVGNHYSVVYVFKLDTNGNTVATQNYSYSSRSKTVQALGAAAAPSGDLYIFGWYDGQQYAFWMRITAALSTPTWQYYGSGYDARDTVNGCVSDSSGNLYWACRYASGGETRIRLGKLNSSGTQQWSYQISGGSSAGATLQQEFRNLGLDSSGNVYMSALSNYGSSGKVAYFVKYDSSGTQQYNRKTIVTSVSSGAEATQTSTLVYPTSNGVMQLTQATGSPYSFGGILNLPADGSKTGTYDYGNTRYAYQSGGVSASSTSISNSNPGISTYSVGLASNNFTLSTGDFTKVLNPISI